MNVSFEQFNTIEGLFWILLSFIVFVGIRFVPAAYRLLAVTTGGVFFMFGMSDFVEIYTGGFIGVAPWLLVWKIVCVTGLLFSLAWYIKLRLTRK
ncbi:MAG: hypothetical protein ACI92I_000656 [Acidimicrobiales bacterium]|jgi:hypothetical protein